jgi:hypothetical protein
MKYNALRNKLMSALLAVVLFFALIPVAVYAADIIKAPAQSVTEGISIIPTVESNGRIAAVIPEESVADTIAAAMESAKAQGKSADGIGISIFISLPDKGNSIDVILPQAVLKRLVDSGIKQLKVNSSILAMNFDLEAVKEIQKQSTGDVTIAITPTMDPIGTKQVYKVAISCVKDETAINITDMGAGTATISFPNKAGENAAPFIPGGYYGRENEAAAPFIPGGRK